MTRLRSHDFDSISQKQILWFRTLFCKIEFEIIGQNFRKVKESKILAEKPYPLLVHRKCACFYAIISDSDVLCFGPNLIQQRW